MEYKQTGLRKSLKSNKKDKSIKLIKEKIRTKSIFMSNPCSWNSKENN